MKESKQDLLFNLIKSLTKTEKRYFQHTSSARSLKGENKYLYLFNVLIKFKVYDEVRLKKKVKEVIKNKDFTFTKSYLYKMLLENLNDFHRQKISYESVLNEMTLSIEVLYQKSLYTAALKLCEKGLKKVEIYECFEHQLIIEKWRYKILEKLNKEDVDAYELNAKMVLSKIKNNIEYKIVSDKVYRHVILLGISRSKKEVDDLKKLMQSPFLMLENKAKGLFAKILFYNTKALSAYFEKDYKKSKNYYLNSLQILAVNEKFANNNPEIYISTYNNYIISNTHLGAYPEVIKGLTHLKKHASQLRDSNLKITTYLNLFSLELPFYITTGKFYDGYEALGDIIKIHHQYALKFNPVQNRFIQYFIAYILFANKQFKEALVWLNNIINSPNIIEREILFVFTRLLKLIIHYELKDYDYLDAQLRSVKTYLSNTEREYHIENTSILLLKELSAHPENEDQTLAKYKEIYEGYFEEYYNIFGYFNFISWIDSKLEKNPYIATYEKFLADVYAKKIPKE